MMQIQTILILIFAALVAFGIVCFHYYYKNKTRGKLSVVLSFFRFITLFSLGVLLINPKFVKRDFVIEKTNLVLLVDNSSSVKPYQESIRSVLDKISANQTLNQKFEVQKYQFGEQLKSLDTLNFTASLTDISQALKAVSAIYTKENTIAVLVSDGNQTKGEAYEFYANKLKFPIYSVVIGDTTRYEDLSINQVNTNKYAFLKNKFPIEVYVSYEGRNSVSTPVTVTMNDKKVYQTQVQFSATEKTKRISTFLEAQSIGLKTIKLNIGPLTNEKNTANNEQIKAVEVIDERTNVAILTAISHPDIGALKKAIEANEQRSVRVVNTSTALNELDEVDVFLLYQPDASFRKIYTYIQHKKANTFSIIGVNTDLNFINSVQSQFQIETGFPVQEVFGVPNLLFSKFDISDFSLNDFPPLQREQPI